MNAPLIFDNLKSWRNYRGQLRALSIGFVPTMGALHQGHATLLKRSREENQISILSIYVNPTQFDNKDDLKRYPITLDRDLKIASDCGVDAVLLPSYNEIYPDGYRYRVLENSFSQRLCGEHRPGHFDGVLTVVMKLLNLVQADRAYFGEKDHQQLQLIRGMTEAFFLPTQIIACPTVREKDGLAMSSRNVNLSPEGRERAPAFAQALKASQTIEEAKARLSELGFNVDYVEDIGARRYGAVKIDNVRLIDNVER
jgi:pantoate--beta-alanine ligase